MTTTSTSRFTRRAAALLVVATAALGLGVGSDPAHAVPSATVHTSVVQQGSQQTFFVTGAAPGTNMLRVGLYEIATSTNRSTAVFSVDAAGVPVADYTRILVPASAPTGDYLLRFFTSGETSPWAQIPIEVEEPDNTASVTIDSQTSSSITISGAGFRRENLGWNSVIGIKLDGGAYYHASDIVPLDSRPSGGASTQYVWYYIGPNTLIDTNYSTNSITGGSFTVTIPLPSGFPTGSHSLTFLTGSMDDTPANQGATYPDVARGHVVSFTH